MAIKLNAQEYAEKWSRNTQNAVGDYQRGVDRVDVAPGQRAAAQADTYAQNVAAAKDKWKERVGSVSLQEWKTMTKKKGGQRLAQGVQDAQPKMAAVAGPLLQHVDSVTEQVRAMPKGTMADSKARVNAFMDGMHEFRKPS